MDSIQILLDARKPFDIAINEVKKQQYINSQMYNALMFALEVIYPEYDGSFQAIQKAIQESTHIVYKIGSSKELRVMDVATNKSQPLMEFIKSQKL